MSRGARALAPVGAARRGLDGRVLERRLGATASAKQNSPPRAGLAGPATGAQRGPREGGFRSGPRTAARATRARTAGCGIRRESKVEGPVGET